MKSFEKIKREIALMLPLENRDIVINMRLAKKIISAIRLHDSRERKLKNRVPDRTKSAVKKLSSNKKGSVRRHR